MRYIGSKILMLSNIKNVIDQNTENVQTIADVFSGTGVVSRFFKQNGYSVYSNDSLYMSYVLSKGMLEMDNPIRPKLKETINHLNTLTIENAKWFDINTAFIYQNYSPNENSKRMYFQNKNAIKIDLIRQEIERLKPQITESEYFYLLALLINAVPYVSNITGTYGAYVKFWDKRTCNSVVLQEIEILHGNVDCKC